MSIPRQPRARLQNSDAVAVLARFNAIQEVEVSMQGFWRQQNVSNRAVLVLGTVLLILRTVIAAHLPLLGDEAFYWQESRALALSYSDLPPMTAWLIAVGTQVAGDSVLGVRWPFLVIGAVQPWILWRWARWRLGDGGDANLVAIYAMLLPLATIGGALALPEAPLTVLMVTAFVLLDRAADRQRWSDWGVLGMCLALAALTHWRAAVLGVAGLLWVMVSPRGRHSLRQPGLWMALLIAIAGVFPALWFNAQHDWSALRFQVLERNPWWFQSSGLWIALEQVVVVTPLLACAVVAAWSQAWRQRADAPFDLIWVWGIGIVGFYLLAGLFADNERTRVHWPLPGYLPLLLAVPALLQRWQLQPGWRRLIAAGCLATTAIGAAFVLAVLAFAASNNALQQHAAARIVGTGLLGWPQALQQAQRLAAALPEDSVVIADNFLLGAQLDFAQAGGHPIYVLDHPRNVRHGRQAQLAIWQRDESHLFQRLWSRGLLVVEVAARAPGERLAAWQSLCQRFGAVRWLHEEHVADTGSSFLYAEVRPKPVSAASGCDTPIIAHVDFPQPDQVYSAGQSVLVAGWAIADGGGVASVSVLLDGVPVATAETHLLAPHVQTQWPQSRDPDHPFVGFSRELDTGNLAPGRHRIEIEAHGRSSDALTRRFGPFWVVVR
jgi:4-amino-4-deoxy-L-arabinose transferase-like glycosyltransferase